MYSKVEQFIDNNQRKPKKRSEDDDEKTLANWIMNEEGKFKKG